MVCLRSLPEKKQREVLALCGLFELFTWHRTASLRRWQRLVKDQEVHGTGVSKLPRSSYSEPK